MTAASELKIRHLEMLQNVISRMSSNSFQLKAWTVTLVAALFALAARDARTGFVVVAYFPVIVFWILDAYYLSQERLFRAKYDEVRTQENSTVDFSMDTSEVPREGRSWVDTMLSRTLTIFYLSLLLIIILATVLTVRT